MLRLSKRIEYALLALQYISSKNYLVTAKEISESLNISFDFLSKTLQILTKNRIVKTQRGFNGGYELDMSPSEINISLLADALEDKIKLTECLSLIDGNGCDRSDNCSIKNPLAELQKRIEQVMVTTTLSDLSEQNLSNQTKKYIKIN